MWQDLTNTTDPDDDDPENPDFPANACGIAMEAQGNDAYVKVITTAGTVYQTHGDVEGNAFIWDEGWTQQTTPTPVQLRSMKFKGDLRTDGRVNRH
ncbi:hypothetical protein RGF97_19460 [Streptomyces roseicoloratus]|uniref:Uncharacterized protein n=1 Tax=Streptomyces roseicoloratus TaxID=2508722 RepID=A0ABY9RWL5_9ACTN|nr:hypothetical protein [Streptomyces roseicoloratus]WMX46571.1 hypothetical protein RGF97_19460 [Streptomyces roseicoloratus]